MRQEQKETQIKTQKQIIMDDLMEKIAAIDGLKSNQNLSYEEKQDLIRKEIEVYTSGQRFAAYRRGIAAAERAVGQLLK